MPPYNYANASAQGLRLQGKPDTHEGLLNSILAREAAQKKAKEEKEVDLNDFDSQMKDLLPVYNTQALKVGKEYVERYNKYRQIYGDDVKAKNALNRDAIEFQTRFANIKANNDKTKQLLTVDQSKYMTPYQPDLYKLAYNKDATPEEWQGTLSKYGGAVLPEYGFDIPLIEHRDLPDLLRKQFAQNVELDGQETKKLLDANGNWVTGKYTVTNRYKPTQEAIEGSYRLLTDPANLANYTAKFRNQIDPKLLEADYFNPDPEKRLAAQEKELKKFAEMQLRFNDKPVEVAREVPQRETEGERNPTYDMKIDYSTDKNGVETIAVNPKGAITPHGYDIDVRGTKEQVGIPAGVKMVKDKPMLLIGVPALNWREAVMQGLPIPIDRTIEVPYNPRNATTFKNDVGMTPFDIRAEANRRAGYKGAEDVMKVYPETISTIEHNLYKPSVKKHSETVQVSEKKEGKEKTRKKFNPVTGDIE